MHLADSIHATARDSGLPGELKDFWGHHAGETFLVCGCGSSLSQVIAPKRFVTIGVNDVGRLFHPDYLVVLNPPGQFSGDRFRYVERSRASAIFTQTPFSPLWTDWVGTILGTMKIGAKRK